MPSRGNHHLREFSVFPRHIGIATKLRSDNPIFASVSKDTTMEKENRKRLITIILSAVLLLAAIVIDKTAFLKDWQLLLIYLVPYLIAGYETLLEAAEKIIHGEVFDEDFLMSIATTGALCIGFLPDAENQFAEAVFVMLFFQVGELFEEMAEGKSRKSISALMDLRPDTAETERDSKILTVSPEELKIGDIIVIRPGARIPTDAEILEGESLIDTSALTGESVPVKAKAGDSVLSGCINQSGLLKAKVTKEYGQSTAAKILELVENASDSKSRTENFITRFAKVYTPVVVGLAVLIALLPPLISGDFGGQFAAWLYRALTFLIVSCPCALVISVPLAFFGGIGGASRHGILFKGSNYLEAMAKLDTVVFDKTGTLTEGVFEVTAVHPENMDENELLHLASHAEEYSTHPIAQSLRNAWKSRANEYEDCGCKVSGIEEIAGRGTRAVVNGERVCVGNAALMDSAGAKWKACEERGTIAHVSVGSEYAGHIVVSDRIKADAANAVKALKEMGVRKTVMLSGDKEEVCGQVAGSLGIDEYVSGLLPDGKVAQMERLLREKPEGKTLAFVGDGINDAPVLARADVGIAMGALGSDAAIEAADVVLMDDKPSRIADGISIARKTLRISRQNVVLALAVKFSVLVLAVFGLTPLWLAVFADVGVTVIAVLNSMRTLKS